MSIWYWVASPVHAHWRRFLLPGGIALGTWGNGLYSAHPALSLNIVQLVARIVTSGVCSGWGQWEW